MSFELLADLLIRKNVDLSHFDFWGQKTVECQIAFFTDFFSFFSWKNNYFLEDFRTLWPPLFWKNPKHCAFRKTYFCSLNFQTQISKFAKKNLSNLGQNHDVSFSYLVEQSQCFQDFLGNINMNGVICEIVSTDENAALIDIWCVISGPGYLKFKVVKQITQIMNSYTFQIICWNYFFSSTSSQIFPHNCINYSCDFHNFTMTVAMSIGNKFQFL